MGHLADDRELHLAGTTRIVNSMSIFDFNGGLGEAAAWLCLREDIYVSLVKQCPLRTNLDTFLQSEVFQRSDDAAYACRMVFLLAKVLSCAFSGCSPCPPKQLESIRAEVDAWFESKPPSFNPIRDDPKKREEGRSLPEIWVLSAFHGPFQSCIALEKMADNCSYRASILPHRPDYPFHIHSSPSNVSV